MKTQNDYNTFLNTHPADDIKAYLKDQLPNFPEGPNKERKQRAELLIDAVVPSLIWLRNNEKLALDILTLQDHFSLEGVMGLKSHKTLPQEPQQFLKEYIDLLHSLQDSAANDEEDPLLKPHKRIAILVRSHLLSTSEYFKTLPPPPSPPSPPVYPNALDRFKKLLHSKRVHLKKRKLHRLLAVGRPREIITYLIGIMPEIEGEDSLWSLRAKELISAGIPPIVWLRDNRSCWLNLTYLKDSFNLKNIVSISRENNIPELYRKPLQSYLDSLPGYTNILFNDDGTEKSNLSGPPADYSTIYQQHGYLAMHFIRPLDYVSNELSGLYD